MEKLKEWLSNYREKILVGGAAVLFFIVLILSASLLMNKDTEQSELPEILSSMAAPDEVQSSVLPVEEGTEKKDTIMYVDIKGAVRTPGVYEMREGDRIQNIIQEAGGFTAEAEQKNINLALKLTDQMMVYIPKTGEEEIVQNAVSASGEESNQVNINTADTSGLTSLSGIGEKKAEKIIQYREENGSFKSIEEIKEVSGIGEKTFENLKEFIKVEE